MEVGWAIWDSLVYPRIGKFGDPYRDPGSMPLTWWEMRKRRSYGSRLKMLAKGMYLSYLTKLIILAYIPQFPSTKWNQSISFDASLLSLGYLDVFHIFVLAKLVHMEKLDKIEIMLLQLI